MDIEASKVLEGLGGAANVRQVEGCITRLRVEVNNPAEIDEVALREAGVFAVVLQDSVAQIVVGPVADDLATAVGKLVG